jgi:hypothetical protein
MACSRVNFTFTVPIVLHCAHLSVRDCSTYCFTEGRVGTNRGWLGLQCYKINILRRLGFSQQSWRSLKFPGIKHCVDWCRVVHVAENNSGCIFGVKDSLDFLTLIMLTWKIWWAPNNDSKWQMGFNSAFKGLNSDHGASKPLRKKNPVTIYHSTRRHNS